MGLAPIVAAIATSACGSDHVVVNERMLLQQGSALVPEGGGCMWTTLPAAVGGALGAGGGDISVAEGAEGDAYVVHVFSDDALLASRSYSAPMLESGQLDEFTVTTHAGSVFVFRYWGGSCADLAAPLP
jgi:hypothetical protein